MDTSRNVGLSDDGVVTYDFEWRMSLCLERVNDRRLGDYEAVALYDFVVEDDDSSLTTTRHDLLWSHAYT